MLDDDETMGGASKLAKKYLTRFKTKFFLISFDTQPILLLLFRPFRTERNAELSYKAPTSKA